MAALQKLKVHGRAVLKDKVTVQKLLLWLMIAAASGSWKLQQRLVQLSLSLLANDEANLHRTPVTRHACMWTLVVVQVPLHLLTAYKQSC